MKKRILFIIVAAVSATILLFIGVTTAYFTEVEVRNNNITIGKVSIALDEGAFDPSVPVDMVPGSRVEKAPKLTNDGNKDAFVYIKLSVPKAAVTLLNESDDGANERGMPKTGLEGAQQLFKIIADQDDSVRSIPSQSGKDIQITYHSEKAAGQDVPGWMLLSSEAKSKTENGVTSYWDEYVFGYNKKMKPNDETVTLFDDVALKSFIDSQTKGDTEIGVKCYGIQSEYLKPSGTIDPDAEYLSETTLREIYTIVKNKAGE